MESVNHWLGVNAREAHTGATSSSSLEGNSAEISAYTSWIEASEKDGTTI